MFSPGIAERIAASLARPKRIHGLPKRANVRRVPCSNPWDLLARTNAPNPCPTCRRWSSTSRSPSCWCSGSAGGPGKIWRGNSTHVAELVIPWRRKSSCSLILFFSFPSFRGAQKVIWTFTLRRQRTEDDDFSAQEEKGTGDYFAEGGKIFDCDLFFQIFSAKKWRNFLTKEKKNFFLGS